MARRNGCFQFLPALVFHSVLICLVNGECSHGGTESTSAVELRRMIMNEMKSSRNDKISIQIQNPSDREEPSAVKNPRLDSVDRRLDTLDQFVKTQSRLLISKMETHDEYLRSHVGSIESLNQNLESIRTQNGNRGSYSSESDWLKSSVESLNQHLEILRKEQVNRGNCSCETDQLKSSIENLNQNMENLRREKWNSSNYNKETDGLKSSIENLNKNLESLRRGNGNNGGCSGEANRQNNSGFPQDCADIKASGHNESGIYRIFPKLPGSFSRRVETEVYCDMETSGNGWLVFQRRENGDFNFERTWREYETGFGNIKGEFWLGNDMLHLLTSNKNCKLRIEMEDFVGQKRHAEYATFSVSSLADKYRLTVAGYSGNAGDSLSYHNAMQFSTPDSDNDKASTSCAVISKGAWWYNNCHYSNLNGRYLHGNHTSSADGVNWYAFRGYNHSLKRTEMKISPRV